MKNGLAKTLGNTGEAKFFTRITSGKKKHCPHSKEDKAVETDLARIRRKAEADKTLVFTSLFHHVCNKDNLRQCYKEMDGKKSPGIDGMTKAEYGKNLETNLTDLSERLASMGYKPPPTRRTYIPKVGSSKMRPLGISCFEAKLVEQSLKKVLEQIYEPYFLDSSYGYRPGYTAHQALDALGRSIQQKRVSFVAEADIKGFFDHVNHEWMIKFLKHRLGDPRILRLIQRFLKSGIMEEGLVKASEEGTPQGSILSPLLSNIYLHYVLDQWFELRMKKAFRGEAYYFRYADDFVACFQYKSDAELYLKMLEARLEEFHLELSKEKTKLLEFGRYAEANTRKKGGKPETFDFLGFTHYCGKTRHGVFKVKRRTMSKKFTYKLKEFNSWLKKERSHLKKGEILMKAKQKWQGHLNYYAITDNLPECEAFGHWLKRILLKWLNRQSQRKSYTWEGFTEVLRQIGWPLTRRRVKLCPFQKSGLMYA